MSKWLSVRKAISARNRAIPSKEIAIACFNSTHIGDAEADRIQLIFLKPCPRLEINEAKSAIRYRNTSQTISETDSYLSDPP